MNIKPNPTPLPSLPKSGLAFVACALTLFAGCATAPAQTAFYAAPPGEPAAMATIRGSIKTEAPATSQITYLAAIDGQAIENAEADFDQEVSVVPGYRALTVACTQSHLHGTSEITVELKAAHTYILRAGKAADDNASLQDGNQDALNNIWIEDASTHEIVGTKHLAKLNATNSTPPNSANNEVVTEAIVQIVGIVVNAMIEAMLAPDQPRTANTEIEKSSPPPTSSGNPLPKKAPPSDTPDPMSSKTLPNKDAPQGKLKNL